MFSYTYLFILGNTNTAWQTANSLYTVINQETPSFVSAATLISHTNKLHFFRNVYVLSSFRETLSLLSKYTKLSTTVFFIREDLVFFRFSLKYVSVFSSIFLWADKMLHRITREDTRQDWYCIPTPRGLDLRTASPSSQARC